MKKISFILIIICFVSCKSTSGVESVTSKVEKQDSTAWFSMIQSVDTIYLRDSIYIREIQRGDTIYLTRTEWRDRWRIREVHDTIHDTQYVTQTEYIDRLVQQPLERYVPKFYKWCTVLFCILIILFIFSIFIRIYKSFRII